MAMTKKNGFAEKKYYFYTTVSMEANSSLALNKFCEMPEYLELLRLIQQLQKASQLHALNEDGQSDVIQFFGEGLTTNHEPFYFYLCLNREHVPDPKINIPLINSSDSFVLTMPFNLRFSWDYDAIEAQHDLCGLPLMNIDRFNISKVFVGSKIDKQLLMNYPREFNPVHIWTDDKNEKVVLTNYIRIFNQILVSTVVLYNDYINLLEARRKIAFDKKMADLIAFQNCPKRKAEAKGQYEMLTKLVNH